MGEELVVSDDDYTYLKEALASYGEAFEEEFTEYLRILVVICETIITEGATAQSLKNFSLHAATLSGKTKELTDSLNTACTSFVGAIDEADKYLYN